MNMHIHKLSFYYPLPVLLICSTHFAETARMIIILESVPKPPPVEGPGRAGEHQIK